MPNDPYWIVLDVEVLHSPDDCSWCSQPEEAHIRSPRQERLACLPTAFTVMVTAPAAWGTYSPRGWSNKAALGLSIGCAWDSLDQRTHFFDEHNLQETMQRWVDEQPLIVTFNGISFDLTLLRGILRRRAETLPPEEGAALTVLCDAFKVLCASSYDILFEIWQADPASKRVKGLNGLGALSEANGYGGKTGHGADAPRDWAAGKIATVVNYCAFDVELTRRLFDQIQRGEPILRSNGTAILLPKAGGAA